MGDGYPITCTKCGKDDEVPFKPRNLKTVLCNECFRSSGGARNGGKSGGSAGDSASAFPTPKDTCMARMSAFRGLCELIAAAGTDGDAKLEWVTVRLEAATTCLVTGDQEKLRAAMSGTAEVKKTEVSE